jgi:hypothetical protein
VSERERDRNRDEYVITFAGRTFIEKSRFVSVYVGEGSLSLLNRQTQISY